MYTNTRYSYSCTRISLDASTYIVRRKTWIARYEYNTRKLGARRINQKKYEKTHRQNRGEVLPFKRFKIH